MPSRRIAARARAYRLALNVRTAHRTPEVADYRCTGMVKKKTAASLTVGPRGAADFISGGLLRLCRDMRNLELCSDETRASGDLARCGRRVLSQRTLKTTDVLSLLAMVSSAPSDSPVIIYCMVRGALSFQDQGG